MKFSLARAAVLGVGGDSNPCTGLERALIYFSKCLTKRKLCITLFSVAVFAAQTQRTGEVIGRVRNDVAVRSGGCFGT